MRNKPTTPDSPVPTNQLNQSGGRCINQSLRQPRFTGPFQEHCLCHHLLEHSLIMKENELHPLRVKRHCMRVCLTKPSGRWSPQHRPFECPVDLCSVYATSVSTKPALKHQVISLKSRELLGNKTEFAFWRGLQLFKANIFKVQSVISLFLKTDFICIYIIHTREISEFDFLCNGFVISL